MSLALAFRARLREPDLLPDLVERVRMRAEVRGWLAADAEPVAFARARVVSLDGSSEERARVRLGGVWVNPHFGADDMGLVFDHDTGELVDASRAARDAEVPEVRGFGVARTTWADAPTHLALLELLEDLAAADLASVEMGDPDGRPLATDIATAEKRLREGRTEAMRAARARPAEAFRLGGFLECLAPAEAARRRDRDLGPLDLVGAAERDLLARAPAALVEAWGSSAPGLDGPPDVAVRALEQLTDFVLSHPGFRHEPDTLERFAFDSGMFLGSCLIGALGGQWERVDGAKGPVLRVANLGGVGLTWRPLHSAAERLRLGPLHAHDGVAAWLAGVVDVAREVFLC